MIHVRQGPRVWRNLTLLEVFLDMLLHGAQPHLHELFGQLLVLLSVAGQLRIFEASKACFFFSGKSAFFQTRGKVVFSAAKVLIMQLQLSIPAVGSQFGASKPRWSRCRRFPTKVWGHAALADCGGNLRLGPEIVGSKVIQTHPTDR